MLAFVVRVLVSAHIKPGPAVKTAILHSRHVIGNKIVPKFIALVHRRPQLTRRGMNCKPDRIANACRKNAAILAIWIVFKNPRAVLLRFVITDIRFRSNRNEQFFPVTRKNDVARPMPAAGKYAAAGK